MVDFSLLRPAPNYLEVYGQSYQQGRETRRQREVENALAGYEDDPEGTESALTRYGEIGTAQTLRQRREAAAKEAEAKAAQEANTATARQVAQGDYAGARASYAERGDLEGIERLDQLQGQDRERAQHGAQLIYNLTGAIQARSQDPAERKAIALHLLEGMAGQIDPREAALLKAQIEEADWSDAGIAEIRARQQAFMPQPAPPPPRDALADEKTRAEIDRLKAQAERDRREAARAGGGGRARPRNSGPSAGATYSDVPVGARVVR